MAEDIRPRRSLLYVPASNAKAIAKARTLPCDVVIMDLEDAVAPEAKDAARALAIDALKEGGFGGREVVVRANGLDTPWGGADLAALAAAGPDAVLVPKVSAAADVARCHALFAAAPEHTGLWAMIETTRGILRLDEIGAQAASTRLACWVMGTNDLAKEMRAEIDAERVPFQGMLALSVAAARANGRGIVDGVFNDFADEEGFAAQCRQARRFGFDGKTLIHPRQIAACNRAFTPSDEAVTQARAIAAAFQLPENRDKGALQLDGRMVERLHLEEARRLIAFRERISSDEEAA